MATQRIVRVRDGEAGDSWGLLVDDETVDLLADSPFDGLQPTGEKRALASVKLLAPIDTGARLIGVGLNYMKHAEESNLPAPEQPMLFHLPSTAIVGQGDDIVYPREGQVIHFEGELGVVIGRPARRVSAANALDYVLGYTIANDVSERVIQKKEMANGCMLICKGYDTFKPLGPCIVTDLDPSDLQLTTRVNGDVKQSSSTSDLIFPVPQLIEYMSAAITLLPGDIIITGTPSGVGDIHPGDEIVIDIEGIGTLSNSVVAEG
ncbi:MAG: fumarylacetoacetate hydrolase family protein [Gemmatimonadetes bacterium]|jgi:2-keto-4-pentenoate hydratase/2-oxohepta-3-ene-1,7-dioic acid hydratase in catechol pathway|nr:fumarylacetoacetate hydrolase family protein [Gemmatimonadota bacterium]MBT5055471.1 fumarylacetoacetate hydrolase family protein [Gemmatimonadota bacterium]MBT5143390.1 fumarylacetoacetate hydrolase family protein [Gemmatimonadota bacterium]MBT5586676.1 fumarylacetoacetate hydrolase family protein [Gemmatimonadota bacterium]MBT5963431.1 fumarylacetoacetate hydrolase family protein [Gemmatimonadota bacterium]